uniref:Uncharacterized protein n=1 Tax=Pinguiococcus pyrenoidosus TaxID=172671 RepID=A0A7R9Y7B8_9STRA
MLTYFPSGYFKIVYLVCYMLRHLLCCCRKRNPSFQPVCQGMKFVGRWVALLVLWGLVYCVVGLMLLLRVATLVVFALFIGAIQLRFRNCCPSGNNSDTSSPDTSSSDSTNPCNDTNLGLFPAKVGWKEAFTNPGTIYDVFQQNLNVGEEDERNPATIEVVFLRNVILVIPNFVYFTLKVAWRASWSLVEESTSFEPRGVPPLDLLGVRTAIVFCQILVGLDLGTSWSFDWVRFIICVFLLGLLWPSTKSSWISISAAIAISGALCVFEVVTFVTPVGVGGFGLSMWLSMAICSTYSIEALATLFSKLTQKNIIYLDAGSSVDSKNKKSGINLSSRAAKIPIAPKCKELVVFKEDEENATKLDKPYLRNRRGRRPGSVEGRANSALFEDASLLRADEAAGDSDSSQTAATRTRDVPSKPEEGETTKSDEETFWRKVGARQNSQPKGVVEEKKNAPFRVRSDTSRTAAKSPYEGGGESKAPENSMSSSPVAQELESKITHSLGETRTQLEERGEGSSGDNKTGESGSVVTLSESSETLENFVMNLLKVTRSDISLVDVNQCKSFLSVDGIRIGVYDVLDLFQPKAGKAFIAMKRSIVENLPYPYPLRHTVSLYRWLDDGEFQNVVRISDSDDVEMQEEAVERLLRHHACDLEDPLEINVDSVEKWIRGVKDTPTDRSTGSDGVLTRYGYVGTTGDYFRRTFLTSGYNLRTSVHGSLVLALGCLCIGLGIDFGVLPRDVYSVVGFLWVAYGAAELANSKLYYVALVGAISSGIRFVNDGDSPVLQGVTLALALGPTVSPVNFSKDVGETSVRTGWFEPSAFLVMVLGGRVSVHVIIMILVSYHVWLYLQTRTGVSCTLLGGVWADDHLAEGKCVRVEGLESRLTRMPMLKELCRKGSGGEWHCLLKGEISQKSYINMLRVVDPSKLVSAGHVTFASNCVREDRDTVVGIAQRT